MTFRNVFFSLRTYKNDDYAFWFSRQSSFMTFRNVLWHFVTFFRYGHKKVTIMRFFVTFVTFLSHSVTFFRYGHKKMTILRFRFLRYYHEWTNGRANRQKKRIEYLYISHPLHLIVWASIMSKVWYFVTVFITFFRHICNTYTFFDHSVILENVENVAFRHVYTRVMIYI